MIERYGSIRPAGRVDSSSHFEALANLGRQVRDTAYNIGVQKRTKEGREAGLLAGQKAAETGQSPEVQESLFPNAYDEAFQASQQSAYLASIDRQAVERISALEGQFSHDAEGFQKTAKGVLDGLTANAPEAYRPLLSESIKRYVSRGTIRVNNNILEQGKKEAESSLTGAVDTYSKEAFRAARNGDFESVDDFLGKMELSAKSLSDGGFWTKEQAKQAVLSVRKGIFRQETKRGILSVAEKDPQKALKELSSLEKKTPENHSPDEWERVIDDIRADVYRLIKPKGGLKEGNNWLKSARESLKFGFKLSESDKARGLELLEGTDKHKDYNRLIEMEKFALLDAEKRNVILSQLTGAKDLQSQKYFIDAQKTHDDLSKMAKEDGISLAHRQGRIEPSDISHGDFSARNDQAEILSEIYGVKVSPFMESEIQDIVRKLPEMTPSEKADMSMSMGGNPATYMQLDKKNASVFAMLSARGDRNLSEMVFLGEELIKTKQFKVPSQKDYIVTVDEYLGKPGEVYGSEDRATIIKAALSHYAAVGNEEYDPGLFEKSLEAITGGIGEVNGSRIELPPEISEDWVEEFMDTLQPETIEAFGGLKYPHDIEDIRDARLISRGDGRYHLEINGVLQPNKDGGYFEIELDDRAFIENRVIHRNKRVDDNIKSLGDFPF